MPIRFPYRPVVTTSAEPILAPLMPLELRLGEGTPVRAQALVDSGATVNVMPYRLGLKLGAKWDEQTTTVKLTGNLADQEARALLVEALISGIEPVRLVFAWSQS